MALLWAVAAPALAQTTDAEEGSVLSFDVHGFGSQGFLITTGNDYLVVDSKRGSYQLSEVGLNLATSLTDRLRFGVQFFAQNFGPSGKYTPTVDWFYLDYRWKDGLGLRAGRLKIPYGLYNEVNDVDVARVPVLLPQSVYPLQARTFLFAQNGGELYGFLRSAVAGGLEYRLFAGTIVIDPDLVVPAGSSVELRFNVPYAFGGRLLWEAPVTGLRLAGSFLKLRLDTVAFLPMGMQVGIENNSYRWAASAEYALRSLTFTAEYSRNHAAQKSVLASSNFERTAENAYVMVTYAATSWLYPGLYYSLHYPNVEERDGQANKQHDVSLTLRFDINRHWLFKLEGHYLAGTAGLSNPVQIGTPPASAERHWALFLAKTTAYF